MKEPKLRGNGLPDVSDASLDWPREGREIDEDALFEGVTWRRVIAFCIDFAILGLIFTSLGFLVVLSFGLFAAFWPLTPLLPVAYHTWMIAGRRSATCGMQVMGVEVRTMDGKRPSFLQAFVMTALFYLSVTTLTPFILLIALFSDRGRCVHDILSGTAVVLTDPDL
tara:strand:- start:79 stop:579 length:501 start_codon:yes stop_codon:yes gene_type:complete